MHSFNTSSITCLQVYSLSPEQKATITASRAKYYEAFQERRLAWDENQARYLRWLEQINMEKFLDKSESFR